MKKILLILCMFLLCGCASNYVEINDLAIVTGIALDYKDDIYDVYTQVIINDKESSVFIYNTKSTSIEEAIAEVSRLSNKQIFIADMKVLIITSDVIKNNANYYDYFLRSTDSKMDFNVYIADKEEIRDILNLYRNKDGASMYTDSMINVNQKVFSSSSVIDFLSLIKTILDEGINPVYPVITIKDNNDEKILYLDNLVTFDNNLNIVNLSENNSIFYNVLTNNIENTVFTIPCEDKYFAITINNIKSSFRYKNNDFIIDIKSSGKIDSYSCKYKIDDDKTINKLNSLINDYIKDNVNEIIQLVNKNNVDFIGFKNYIYRKNNKDYKTFDLNKVNIKINSESSIASFGESRKKIGDINGKNK